MDRDPHLAWGFYGHRLNLYRKTDPHRGFHILKEIGLTKKYGEVLSFLMDYLFRYFFYWIAVEMWIYFLFIKKYLFDWDSWYK